jgi:hypothetical protein
VFIAEELQRTFTQVFILRGLRGETGKSSRLVVEKLKRRVRAKESDEAKVDRGRELNEARAENRGAKRANREGLPKNMREYSMVLSSYQYYLSLAL